MKQSHLIITALAAIFIFTTCSKSDDDLSKTVNISASIIGLVNQSDLNAAETVESTLNSGDEIRLTISGNTSSTTIGFKIGSTQLFWDDLALTNGISPFGFSAFYPAIPEVVHTVGFNVVTAANPELLYAAASDVSRGKSVNLLFRHLMHKIVINLSNQDDYFTLEQLNNARVTLKNLKSIAVVGANGVVNLNNASGNDAYPTQMGRNTSFVVAPQTLIAGMDLLEVKIDDETLTYKVPNEATELKSGKMLIFNLVLSEEGIDGEMEEGVVINGMRWATRNVGMPGTFAKNPEDLGMFYQWNRRVGWSANPLINSNGGTVWDESIPTGTTWEKENDPCPRGWRVPTREELERLANAVNIWTALNGVSGRFFGNAPNQIFLSATEGLVSSTQVLGYYWSSTQHSEIHAWRLQFGSDRSAWVHNASSRFSGFLVRCVAVD